MKKSNSAKILGLVALVCGLVAVFFWFGPAFDETGHPYNLIQTAFAVEDHGYPTVWPLVGAFVALCLGSIFAIVVPFFSKKGAVTMGLISLALLVAGGVMTLLTKTFFIAANPNPVPFENFGLGSGTITSAVFAFIAALFVLISTNIARKEN